MTNAFETVANDRGRPRTDKARDRRDATAKVIRFLEVVPGRRIVDFLPFRGYYTRLFSGLVGPTGHIYAAVPRELMKIQRISEASEQVAAFAENHPNTQLCSGRIEKLGGVPKCIDLFWISQNYHDLHDAFMGPVDIPTFNKAVFGVLRRGGLYVIADHSAGLQPPDDATERLHRIGALQVRREVEAAGLVYTDSSPAMRNPADTHTSSVFARGTRFHTDRFVLKFRKP